MNRFIIVLLLIILCAINVFSNKGKGIWHKVKRKETLWRIAYNYKVPMNDIMKLNKIKDATKINTGEWLFIPRKKAPAKKNQKNNIKKILRYPVTGKIIKYFRNNNNDYYNGIEFETKNGAHIRAAADGVVKFTGEIRGYGKVIIITHNKKFTTVYSCLKNINVTKDQSIRSGQLLGSTGKLLNKEKVCLHFQLINNGNPVNPIPYFK